MSRMLTGFRMHATGCYVRVYKFQFDSHVIEALMAAYYQEVEDKIDRVCVEFIKN